MTIVTQPTTGRRIAEAPKKGTTVDRFNGLTVCRSTTCGRSWTSGSPSYKEGNLQSVTAAATLPVCSEGFVRANLSCLRKGYAFVTDGAGTRRLAEAVEKDSSPLIFRIVETR